MSENIVPTTIQVSELSGGDSSTSSGSDLEGSIQSPTYIGRRSDPMGTFPVSPMVPPPKKFPLLLTIVLLFLSFLAAISIYLFLQIRTLSLEKNAVGSISPSPTPSPDPTSSWQSYTNSTYNFSFKYPSDWVYTQYLPNSPDVITFQSKNNIDAKSKSHSVVLDISSNCLNTQCLTVYSLDEMMQNRSVTKIDELKIGNVIAYKTSLVAGGIAYIFIKENNFIQISTDDQSATLNQIISTFQFIDNPYVCPESGYVDCMPGPDKDNSACSEDAMKWYKANCPGFQGGAL